MFTFLCLPPITVSVSTQTPGDAVLSAPFCTKLGIFWAIQVSAVGTSQGSNQVIIFGVFMNSTTGQVLGATTAVTILNQGENVTLYLVIPFNLLFENYSAVVFPFTTSGQPIQPIYSIYCQSGLTVFPRPEKIGGKNSTR